MKASKTPILPMSVPEKMLAEILLKHGFQPHIAGYRYTLSALGIILANPETAHRGLTKYLYPEVASRYGSTAARVERAIRHSIELNMDNCTDAWEEFVGYYPLEGDRPTVGWTLFTLAEMIRLKMVS